MYCLNICSICFINKKDLKNLQDKENNELTYYEKLITTIPEMVSDQLKCQKLICIQCTKKIEDFYEFRQKCLKSNTLFNEYVNRLHTMSDIIGEVNVMDIDPNDTAKNKKVVIKSEILEEECNIDLQSKDKEYSNKDKVVVKSEKQDEASVDNIEDDKDISMVIVPSIFIKTEITDDEENIDQHGGSTANQNFANYQHFPNPYDISQNPELEILPCLTNLAKPLFTQPQVSSEPLPKGIFTCKICNRQFSYKSNLQKHELTHMSEMPYSCEVCNTGFRSESNYNEHKENNTCGKTLSQQKELKNHMAVHKETYNCNFCVKTYMSKLGLEKHIRIHMGYKPYVCNVCNKRFNSSSVLKVHSRIHTGEKPYQCCICYKKFSDNSNFTKHLAKYHS